MKTIDWELKVGLFKGLLLGVRHYYRSDESGDYKEEDIVIILERALNDQDNGLGRMKLDFHSDAFLHIANNTVLYGLSLHAKIL